MSQDDKESSGLGLLLTLGAAAASIYTAYKAFNKSNTPDFEINTIPKDIQNSVSILIPGHIDEASETIYEAQKQTHLGKFEVLYLEDRGHEIDKPSDWSKKAWACQRIAFKATGDYLVFIEPDLNLSEDAVSLAINCLIENHLDALLVQPAILNKTEPIVLVKNLLNFPTPLNEQFDANLFANFLVINRSAYSALAGHTRVANKEFEASAWISELQNSNFQIGTANGSALASTFASTEVPELDEDFALKAGSFFGTYVIPVLAILSGKSSLRQFLGSVGLVANIATVIKSKKIR